MAVWMLHERELFAVFGDGDPRDPSAAPRLQITLGPRSDMTISLTTGDGRMLLHVASFPSIEAAKRAAIEFARGRLQAEHQKELAKLCKAG